MAAKQTLSEMSTRDRIVIAVTHLKGRKDGELTRKELVKHLATVNGGDEEENTNAATSTLLIETMSSDGWPIDVQNGSTSTFVVEADGKLRAGANSDDFYYALGDSGSQTRIEEGQEAITGQSTGTVTFDTAFSATPTITISFYNSTDYTTVISAGHNGGSASTFNWALGAAATGTVHWIAVGSN